MKKQVLVCIPAHAPRLEELLGCIETMRDGPIRFFVVTNEPWPIRSLELPVDVLLYNTGSEEINLSKWWNLGLDVATMNGIETLMVTESDVRMTPENVARLHDVLWQNDFGMVGPNLYGNMPRGEISVETRQDDWGARHAGHRICQTWMVKTRKALRADERFAWWHADEQHEMSHRAVGMGTAIVGSAVYERPLFQSTEPGESPVLSEACRTAKAIFEREWGFGTLI